MGLANSWHLVHLGAGLVMVEASAVDPRGRITPADLGIWSDAHTAALAPIAAFAAAATRSVAAGFRLIEIHAAHGYLINEFLSPLANQRTDEWGGSFDNRIRFLREVIRSVRAAIPVEVPLAVRVSATDWKEEGGWTPDDAVRLASALIPLGVDLLDCPSGGIIPGVRIPISPGYQVPFAARVRTETGLSTAAVGMITTPDQAEAIIATGKADVVLLARELLRNPYWPLHAATPLGAQRRVPAQYLRAFWPRAWSANRVGFPEPRYRDSWFLGAPGLSPPE